MKMSRFFCTNPASPVTYDDSPPTMATAMSMPLVSAMMMAVTMDVTSTFHPFMAAMTKNTSPTTMPATPIHSIAFPFRWFFVPPTPGALARVLPELSYAMSFLVARMNSTAVPCFMRSSSRRTVPSSKEDEVLGALEERSQVAALAVERDGLLGVVGHERLLVARVPHDEGGARRVGRGHALAEAHVAVLLHQLVERAEVERAQRAARRARGLHALGQAVYAHGALAHLGARLVGGEARRAVGARVVALPAAVALVLVDEHGAELVLLVEGAVRARLRARRVLAVAAGERQRMQADVRERALLPLVDAHPLLGARLEAVPVLARDAARLAGVAAVHVEHKSVLRHGPTPLPLRAPPAGRAPPSPRANRRAPPPGRSPRRRRPRASPLPRGRP